MAYNMKRPATESVIMESALAMKKIMLVSEEWEVRRLWIGAPKCELVLPGLYGDWGFIFKVKEDLKSRGFRFNPDKKLWYRPLAPAEPVGIDAFNLGGVVLKK
jgi:hypothetical protein